MTKAGCYAIHSSWITSSRRLHELGVYVHITGSVPKHIPLLLLQIADLALGLPGLVEPLQDLARA